MDAQRNYAYAQERKAQELHAGARMKGQYANMNGPDSQLPFDKHEQTAFMNSHSQPGSGMGSTAAGLTQQFGELSIMDPS